MATLTEIRQQLVQGGMSPMEAQKAAGILADLLPLTSPSGGIWDTLNAKGFNIVSRPTNTVFRLLTNGTKNIVVVTKDGLNTIFCEMAVESL